MLPNLKIPQAVKKGYIECPPPRGFRLGLPEKQIEAGEGAGKREHLPGHHLLARTVLL